MTESLREIKAVLKLDATSVLDVLQKWRGVWGSRKDLPPFMTLEEAADHSRFSIGTVRTAIKEGRLLASQPEGREYRLTREDLITWLSGSKDKAPAPPQPVTQVLAPLQLGSHWVSGPHPDMGADLLAMLEVFEVQTRGSLHDYSKVVISLPASLHHKARCTPITSAGSESVLNWFLKVNQLREDQVVPEYYLEAKNTREAPGFKLPGDRAVIKYVDEGNLSAITYAEWTIPA